MLQDLPKDAKLLRHSSQPQSDLAKPDLSEFASAQKVEKVRLVSSLLQLSIQAPRKVLPVQE